MNLSVKDAARLLQVSEKTIYRWLKQELIPAYRVQGQHRFNRSELVEWATSRRMVLAHEAFTEVEVEPAPLPTLTEALRGGGIHYRVEGRDRNEVLDRLVGLLNLPPEVDRNYLTQVLIAREELASTGYGDGIAIPHPRNPVLLHIERPVVALAFLEHPVEFRALDGRPVDTLILPLSPTLRGHLHLLSLIGFALRSEVFRRELQRKPGREAIFTALKAFKHALIHRDSASSGGHDDHNHSVGRRE
ncbi:MAG: PTS sugar transporter subunit IIA [Geothermobacteraceae bacterium]